LNKVLFTGDLRNAAVYPEGTMGLPWELNKEAGLQLSARVFNTVSNNLPEFQPTGTKI